MFFMTRGLPVLLEIGLLVFCLVDCLQTPAESTRNLGKGWWILLILFFPIVGGICWLVAGRPKRTTGAAPWPSSRTAGFPEYERPGGRRGTAPDDDPEFLAGLGRLNAEQERTLGQWEADLKRREEQLRGQGPTPDAGETPPRAPAGSAEGPLDGTADEGPGPDRPQDEPPAEGTTAR